jgi:hypothetical protein
MALFFFDSSALVKRYIREQGADAMQFSTAVLLSQTLRNAQFRPLTVVSADDRLLQAASDQGLTVENPNLHGMAYISLSSNDTTGTRHNCGESGSRSSTGRTMPPLVSVGHKNSSPLRRWGAFEELWHWSSALWRNALACPRAKLNQEHKQKRNSIGRWRVTTTTAFPKSNGSSAASRGSLHRQILQRSSTR